VPKKQQPQQTTLLGSLFRLSLVVAAADACHATISAAKHSDATTLIMRPIEPFSVTKNVRLAIIVPIEIVMMSIKLDA
jgi:hypothetical protein